MWKILGALEASVLSILVANRTGKFLEMLNIFLIKLNAFFVGLREI